MEIEFYVPNYQATPEELEVATALLSSSAKAAEILSNMIDKLPRKTIELGKERAGIDYNALHGSIEEAVASVYKQPSDS